MSAPLLTILVPTRNRPELARECIQRLLADCPDEVQIIILENSDVPELACNTVDFRNAVQVHSTAAALDMPSNWERGLSAADGRYVAYIADKDMFLPGALRKLVRELAAGNHEILCYRKAVYCQQRKVLFHYECTGRVVEESLKPMLAHLFANPDHNHSAPMVYNAAVSRELLREIKGEQQRLFIGNSPDVITSILFAAHRTSYSQFDEMFAVAHSGEWSNGYSAVTRGRSGDIAQDFLRLFKTDPLAPLSVPACVPSGILECLLTAQKCYPAALESYAVSWQQYLRNVHDAIERLEIPDEEKRAELSQLTAPQCIVPRAEYWKYRRSQRMHAVWNAVWHTPRRMLGNAKAGVLARAAWLRKSAQKERVPVSRVGTGSMSPADSLSPPMWDGWHYRFQSQAHSIEEALAIAGRFNR